MRLKTKSTTKERKSTKAKLLAEVYSVIIMTWISCRDLKTRRILAPRMTLIAVMLMGISPSKSPSIETTTRKKSNIFWAV